jgi:hypothetical protein
LNGFLGGQQPVRDAPEGENIDGWVYGLHWLPSFRRHVPRCAGDGAQCRLCRR